MKHVLLLLAVLGLAGRPARSQPTFTLTQHALTGKVLSVSDIHFAIPDDIQLQAELVVAKDTADWVGILEKDTAVAQYGTGQPNNTHYKLLTSALEAMSAQCKNPDYIIITGDFPAHNFPITSLPFLTKFYQFLAGRFKQKFPTAIVLPGLGNNDSDEGNYNLPSPEFLEMFARAWVPLLHHHNPAADDKFIKAFSTAGYYEYTFPKGGRRLLMLNSILFRQSTTNADVSKELTWLADRLKNSGSDNLWLAMHIPPGPGVFTIVEKQKKGDCPAFSSMSMMWNEGTADKFAETIEQHLDRIKVMFAGHTHMDEFRLAYDKKGLPGAFFHVTPAISPRSANNPGFQVLTYDTTSLKLLNFATYYRNIDGLLPPQWQLEYDFNTKYHQSAVTAATLQSVYSNLPVSASERYAYRLYYPVSHWNYWLKDFWPYYLCAIGNRRAADYYACVCQYIPSCKKKPQSRLAPRPAKRKVKARSGPKGG